MGGGPEGGPSKESTSRRVTSASRGVSMLGSNANCPPPLKPCVFWHLTLVLSFCICGMDMKMSVSCSVSVVNKAFHKVLTAVTACCRGQWMLPFIHVVEIYVSSALFPDLTWLLKSS